jgi:hypothetical protein
VADLQAPTPKASRARAVAEKAWALSLPHMVWKEPFVVGLLSLLVLFPKDGRPAVLTEASNYGWAALVVALYWMLVLVYNLIRAPYALALEASAALLADRERQVLTLEAAVGHTLPALSPDRVFIPLTLEELMDMVKEHTEMQRSRVAEVYLGKWLRVIGPVWDTREGWPAFSEETSYHVSIDIPGGLVHLSFGAKWKGHIEILRRGDPIIAIGRLTMFDSRGASLKDCELVSTTAEPEARHGS